MKRLVAIVAVAMACAVASQAEGVGLGVEVGKDTYLSVLIPLDGLSLQLLTDIDRESNGSDDNIIELGAALIVPVTEAGDATLNWFVQGMYESITDFDPGYSLKLGLAPMVMVGENVGVGGKLGLRYEKESAPEGDDGNTAVGFEGAVSVHWFF